MVRAARLVVCVERGKRVFLVPGQVHLSREIAASTVDAERRVERDVTLLEILQKLIPLLAVRLDQIPLPGHLAEAVEHRLVAAAEGHLRGPDRVGADVEADAADRHQAMPLLR